MADNTPVPTPSIPPVSASSGKTLTPNPSPNLPPAPQNSTPSGTGSNPAGKVQINPSGPANASGLTYKDLVPVYDATAKRWTTAYVDATGEHWAAMLADPNSPTGYSISTDQTATRLQTMQSLIKQYGTLAKAKTAMAEQGLYQLAGVNVKTAQASVASNTEDDAFDKVLDASIGSISRTNLLNGGQSVQDVASVVYGRPNYAGTKNTATVSETSKDSAYTDIDAFMRKTTGRGATYAEFEDYYNKLHAYELKHPIKAKVTRDALGTETSRVQTEGPSQDDKTAILVSAAYNSLVNAGKDPAAISKIGGNVGVAMQKLNQQAADYGVSNVYDETKAFTGALDSLLPGGTIDGELTKITALAKATPKYKAYAPMFDAGFTLRDIAKPGMDTANKLLEKSTPLMVNDPIMQKYLTGGDNGGQMDDNSFIKYIKSDPTLGWSKTNNARDEAANYATTILKQFGFMG
jgi:hypothetical protein